MESYSFLNKEAIVSILDDKAGISETVAQPAQDAVPYDTAVLVFLEILYINGLNLGFTHKARYARRSSEPLICSLCAEGDQRK